MTVWEEGERLLPCPFRHAGDFLVVEPAGYKSTRVRCTICGTKGPAGYEASDAAARWNNRRTELRTLLSDPYVQEWVKAMGPLLPVKR